MFGKMSELKKGTIISYIYLILNNIIQLIYNPFMLDKLGQAEYGIYSLCISIVNYLTVLDFGLGNAIIKYVSENKENNKKDRLNGLFLKIYGLLAIIVIILGIFIVGNIDIFRQSLTDVELAKAKVILIILIINVSISLPLTVFSSIVIAYQKFVISRILNIVKAIILPLIMIPLLIKGYKAITMSLVTSIISIMVQIILAVYAVKKLKVRFSFKKVENNLIKEITNFSIFSFLLLVVDKINWSIDPIIIGMFIGTEAVAIYSVASHVFQMFLTFPSIISSLLLPKLAEEKDNNETINAVFLKTAKMQFAIAIYILFGFLLVGEKFIKIWAGYEYSESFIIAALLMGAAVIPLSLNTANVILQAKNKQKFRACVLFAIMISNILLSIHFCKQYGIIGCTIGTVITYLLGHILIMSAYFYKKIKLDMKKFYKNIIKVFIPICISFVMSYLIKVRLSNIKIEIIINIIIYSINTGILSYILIFNKKERVKIKNILKKLRSRRCGKFVEKVNALDVECVNKYAVQNVLRLKKTKKDF